MKTRAHSLRTGMINENSSPNFFTPLTTKGVWFRVFLMGVICFLGFCIFAVLTTLIPYKNEDFGLLISWLFCLLQSVTSLALVFFYFKLQRTDLAISKAKRILKIPFFVPLYVFPVLALIFILTGIGSSSGSRCMGYAVTFIGTFCYYLFAHQLMNHITFSNSKKQ